MDPLDDYFEYALDLPEAQRRGLLASLRQQDPALAQRLEAALARHVVNPDFACQAAVTPAPPDTPDRLARITVPVGDVARAADWYAEVFRCRVAQRDPQRAVVVFGAGAVELHLVAAEQEPPSFTIVRRDVAAMGPSERRRDGVRALRLVDPWGNAIEVVDSLTPGAT